MSRIFDKKNIIILKTDEKDITSFLVDKDINDNGEYYFMMDELSKAIIDAIPEYVFAHYEDPNIPQHESVDKLREAAKSIYKIKDYALMKKCYIDGDLSAKEELSAPNRGEFGELLLHLLLRDFKDTIPLISKVYFKDSAGVPAHGFDAVHISPNEKIMWLGESKFYVDSKKGISALISDLKEHFNKDYLDEQFIIIKKNLHNNSIPDRDKWIDILNSCNKLIEKIEMINIPLLCIYPHDIYKQFDDMYSNDANVYHETNVKELKKYFDENNKHKLKSNLNIILMLFPIENKKELAKRLHERLWHMQNM